MKELTTKALTNEIESHVHKVVVVFFFCENFSFNNPGALTRKCFNVLYQTKLQLPQLEREREGN